MGKQPWSKFFWNDYQGDPALRVCSLAAQGLWMRMLCLAAESDPVGYVMVGGRPCTAADLSRLTGESEETVTALLEELDRNGVFSLTRAKIIYNRRMVDAAKRAEEGRKHASKRWSELTEIPEEKPRPNGSMHGPPTTQKPETICQIEERGRGSTAKRGSRLPADWSPNPELLAWAGKTRPDLDLRNTVANFCDHFHSAAGQRGVKLNWEATFRVWIRNERRLFAPKISEPRRGPSVSAVEARAESDKLVERMLTGGKTGAA